MNGFAAEWQVLQTQYDSYEKCSLAIKLVAVMLFIFSLGLQINIGYTAVVIAVLWLQDAIWKTFQSRIESRLYVVEKQLVLTTDSQVQIPTEQAFQFNSKFIEQRNTGLALIKEYILQAFKPTVAYPYVLLLIIILSIRFLF